MGSRSPSTVIWHGIRTSMYTNENNSRALPPIAITNRTSVIWTIYRTCWATIVWTRPWPVHWAITPPTIATTSSWAVIPITPFIIIPKGVLNRNHPVQKRAAEELDTLASLLHMCIANEQEENSTNSAKGAYIKANDMSLVSTIKLNGIDARNFT